MNTMYRCASLALAAALVACSSADPVAPQTQRAFPQNTLRGAMVFGAYPQVTVNGTGTLLSPGSRVRDQDNRIVQAASLTGARMLVHYTLGSGGTQVQDVWILRREEAAINPWPSTLDQAQSWGYDATTMTWTKP
jgi:lipocalin